MPVVGPTSYGELPQLPGLPGQTLRQRGAQDATVTEALDEARQMISIKLGITYDAVDVMPINDAVRELSSIVFPDEQQSGGREADLHPGRNSPQSPSPPDNVALNRNAIADRLAEAEYHQAAEFVRHFRRLAKIDIRNDQ